MTEAKSEVGIGRKEDGTISVPAELSKVARTVAKAMLFAALVQSCSAAKPGPLHRSAPASSSRPGPVLSLSLRGGGRGGSEEATGADYTKMKIAELVSHCKAKGLATHGNKAEVIKRLQEAEEQGVGDSNKRSMPTSDDAGISSKQARTEDNKSVQREPEVRVDDGEMGLVRVLYSYSIKEKLKTAGFNFDKEGACWTFPARLLADRLGLGSCSDITAEKVLQLVHEEHELDLDGIPGESLPPMTAKEQPLVVEIADGVVRLKGGTYAYKDKIRAAGFKWDPASYSWTAPGDVVSQHLLTAGLPGLSYASPESVKTMIENIEPAPLAPPGEGDATAARQPPEVRVEGDRVVVVNSYDVKEQLKSLQFTFDKESKVERAGLGLRF